MILDMVNQLVEKKIRDTQREKQSLPSDCCLNIIEEPDHLLPLLQRTLQHNDVILVKGSRSARMERILPE